MAVELVRSTPHANYLVHRSAYSQGALPLIFTQHASIHKMCNWYVPRTCYANRPFHAMDTPAAESSSWKLLRLTFLHERENHQNFLTTAVLPLSFAFNIYIPEPSHDPSEASGAQISRLQISPSHSPMRYNDSPQEERSSSSLGSMMLVIFTKPFQMS